MKVLVLLLAVVAFSMLADDDMIARSRRHRHRRPRRSKIIAMKKFCGSKKAKKCLYMYGRMGCPRGRRLKAAAKMFRGCKKYAMCAKMANKQSKGAYCDRKCYTPKFIGCMRTWIQKFRCRTRGRFPRGFMRRCGSKRFKRCGATIYKRHPQICSRRYRRAVIRGFKKWAAMERRARRKARRRRRRRDVDEDEDDMVAELAEVDFEDIADDDMDARSRRRRRRRRRVNCRSAKGAICIGIWGKMGCRTRRLPKKFIKHCHPYTACAFKTKKRHPALCSKKCHTKASYKCIHRWAKMNCRTRMLPRMFKRACRKYYKCGKAAKFIFPKMCSAKWRKSATKKFKKYCHSKKALKCVVAWGKKHKCRTKGRRGRRGAAFRKFAKKCGKYHACGKYFKHKSKGALCLRRCHSKAARRCIITWVVRKKCSMNRKKLGRGFIRRCGIYKRCGRGARGLGICSKKGRAALIKHLRKQRRRRRPRRRRREEDDVEDDVEDDMVEFEETEERRRRRRRRVRCVKRARRCRNRRCRKALRRRQHKLRVACSKRKKCKARMVRRCKRTSKFCRKGHRYLRRCATRRRCRKNLKKFYKCMKSKGCRKKCKRYSKCRRTMRKFMKFIRKHKHAFKRCKRKRRRRDEDLTVEDEDMTAVEEQDEEFDDEFAFDDEQQDEDVEDEEEVEEEN